MYSPDIEKFLKKMGFTTEPTSVIKEDGLFIVRWLWKKDGEPTENETEAESGVIHQYSRTGTLEMEIMI